MNRKIPAIFTAEMGLGVYNFPHTFLDSTTAQITVMPISFNFRYILEVNKLFRVYPYLGFQNNIVSSTYTNNTGLHRLRGGRLMAGGGAMLVMSENIDIRADIGIEGMLFGLVSKF